MLVLHQTSDRNSQLTILRVLAWKCSIEMATLVGAALMGESLLIPYEPLRRQTLLVRTCVVRYPPIVFPALQGGYSLTHVVRTIRLPVYDR